ncbi:MAG: AI-2E family transporter [Clostridia bacterium]|nr:AI-2E family transporter [Clostridia bacterium]
MFLAEPGWRRVAAAVAALVLVLFLLRRAVGQVLLLALGASLLSFFAAPLAGTFERKLSRPLASLLALAALGAGLAALFWLLLPTLFARLSEVFMQLPKTLSGFTGQLNGLLAALEARLPGVNLPPLDLSGLGNALPGLAAGTVSAAAGIAELSGKLSMIVVLAYFFLCDRDRLLLRAELLLPSRLRPMAVAMGNAVCRELRLYLRAQLTIAAAVAAMSAAGLMLIGVRGALALGPVIGLLNMIPYFGPFIGGVPAVLIALGDGWSKALMALAVLLIVQQLDGSWISPRVMGSLTGFSPALVLLGIYGGARLGGIGGMLFALPVMMSIRTLFRVYVQKCENI